MKRQDITIHQLAHRLRQCTCLPEYTLWEVLQYEFEEYSFSRLQPLDEYIVDFVCESLKLVIEIGGDSHNIAFGMGEHRSDFLEAAGYQIIRFSNIELLNQMNKVTANLQYVIQREMVMA